MFSTHPAAKLIKRMAVAVALDSATTAQKEQATNQKILGSLAVYDSVDSKLSVAASIQQWAETSPDDLDTGETMADRLFAFMVGIADENKDGDITPEEEVVITMAMEQALDYFMSKGVTEDDALALLNDGDDDACSRVLELLREELPEGDESSMEDVDNFAFGGDDQEPLFDAVFDAVYKKRIVIRAGRKIRINKRISGTVRLSSAQKVGLRKARMKSHSAGAKMHRAKSMRIRARAGIPAHR
jgi:hypothetical protein